MVTTITAYCDALGYKLSEAKGLSEDYDEAIH